MPLSGQPCPVDRRRLHPDRDRQHADQLLQLSVPGIRSEAEHFHGGDPAGTGHPPDAPKPDTGPIFGGTPRTRATATDRLKGTSKMSDDYHFEKSAIEHLGRHRVHTNQ